MSITNVIDNYHKYLDGKLPWSALTIYDKTYIINQYEAAIVEAYGSFPKPLWRRD